MKSKKTLLVVLFIITLFFVTQLHAASVDLVWEPNTEEDLAGYKIYQFINRGWVLIKTIECGPNDASCCKYTLLNVADGTYRWVSTAFDDVGNESEHSDEATKTIDTTTPSEPKGFSATVVIKNADKTRTFPEKAKE